MTRLLAVLILLPVTVALSGCGIRGELQTPPPVWGADKAETTPETETEAEATEDSATVDDPSDLTEDEDPGYGIRVADQP